MWEEEIDLGELGSLLVWCLRGRGFWVGFKIMVYMTKNSFFNFFEENRSLRRGNLLFKGWIWFLLECSKIGMLGFGFN